MVVLSENHLRSKEQQQLPIISSSTCNNNLNSKNSNVATNNNNNNSSAITGQSKTDLFSIRNNNNDKQPSNNTSMKPSSPQSMIPNTTTNNNSTSGGPAAAPTSSQIINNYSGGQQQQQQIMPQPASGPAGNAANGRVSKSFHGDVNSWNKGGPQFSSPKEIYTRSLYRLCLKFTTSEDEDEGKPEPATAYWTYYTKLTTIGNGGTGSHQPDDICRRMDDSMSGPSAGILSRITDQDGDVAAALALQAGSTTGWHIRGDRGDAAVRVGKAKVFMHDNQKNASLLSLDADRWVLGKSASFAAGNSVFTVEECFDRQITVHCTRGPMRGKFIEILANRCPYVFGRAHEADLCIMDRELSRKHGAILFLKDGRKAGSFILTDLESTNGSYMRLVGPYGQRGMGALSIGDEFIVGRTGFSVNRYDYGISEAIGARPTMEDRVVVIQSLMFSPPFTTKYVLDPKEDLSELAMTSFAAVFDGHGGDECSNYLVDALPRHIRSYVLAEKENIRKAIEISRNTNTAQPSRNSNTEPTEDPTSEIMRRILKQAYLRTDKEFITPKSAPQSGSTAATVILMGRRLFAANVGDSRVVLCRAGGQCVELTSDHKPSRPDEAARVRAAGGFILHKRVMGELAITRAFGDKSFKMGIKAMLEEEAESNTGNSLQDGEISKDLSAPLVSAEPEIASMVLSHTDEFLLLACDGLFDVFRSQDAVALARQELIAHRGEPAEVARILSDQAIRVRRSRDNVSILIIILRPFWEREQH